VQWIEIVRDTVRTSRERGDSDPKAFAATLREALGERSLPPGLTRILARARAGRYATLPPLWRALEEVCHTTNRGGVWAVIGVALAGIFGFVIAYGSC